MDVRLDIRSLLEEMSRQGASDLYLTAESPPVLRVEGVAAPLPLPRLSPADTEALANSLMTERQKAIFEEKMEMNLAVASDRLGRFRINVFRQRGCVGVVVRQIKTKIPTVDDLGLPAILKSIVMSRRGLVLVTGATGSGKSTTQAAMIDYRNENEAGHIMTIEDPIEFLIREGKVHQLPSTMQTGQNVGMQTLDMALLELVAKGVVTREEAQGRTLTPNLFGEKPIEAEVKKPAGGLLGRSFAAKR